MQTRRGTTLSGLSKFSPRHNMIRILVCVALITGLFTQVICILTRVRIRPPDAGEVRIHRLGMSNLDHRAELKSHDEIARALHASPAHIKPGKPKGGTPVDAGAAPSGRNDVEWM